MGCRAAIIETEPRRTRLVATALLALGVALLVAPAGAEAIGPKVDVNRRADVVVRGKVVSTKSAWDRDHRLIITYTRVRVTKELKGDSPGYVTIREPGGKVGALRLTVSDQPRFAPSEEVQVNLERTDAATFDVVDGPGAKLHLGGPTPADATPGSEARSDPGYSLTGTEWQSSDLPMPYWINTSFTSTERSVLQTAFDTWENDPNSSMDFEYQGTTSRGGPSYDGYNVMTKGSTGGSIATTYYWSIGGRMLDVDIVYDYYAWPWSTSGESGRFDLLNIATHENGHTLVLGDLYNAANTEQTMYGYASYGETKKRTLHWGDLAGIAAIYPDAGPPSNVSSFVATPGDQSVKLTWRNPSAADFAGVLIVRKTGSAPVSRYDGTQVYDGAGTSFTNTGLANFTTYYYSAYAYDDDGNYASGSTASATPKLESSLASYVSRSTITWGQSLQVNSSLTPEHSPAPVVNVQHSSNGSTWATLAAMRWDESSGAYQMTVSPTSRTYYRASWSGDSDHLGALSSRMAVSVRPKVLVARSSRAIRYRGSILVSGYVYPRHDGRLAGFYFYKYLGGGRWQYRAYRSARLAYNTSTRSRAAVRYRPNSRGTWRARFRFGDADHVAADAYTATFRVR